MDISGRPLPGDTGLNKVDINDHEEVAGISTNGSRRRAYPWQDGVSSDLHLMLAGDRNSAPTVGSGPGALGSPSRKQIIVKELA